MSLIGCSYCWGTVNATSHPDYFAPSIKYVNSSSGNWCPSEIIGLTGQPDTVACVSHGIVCDDPTGPCTWDYTGLPYDSCMGNYTTDLIDIYLIDQNGDTVSHGVKRNYYNYGGSGQLQKSTDTCLNSEFSYLTLLNLTDPGTFGYIEQGWTTYHGETKYSGSVLKRDLSGSNNWMLINGVPSGTYTFVAVAHFSNYFASPDDTVKYVWNIDRGTDVITCLGAAAPAPVALSAPASGSVDNTGAYPIVSWTAVPGATSYELERSIHKGRGDNSVTKELITITLSGTSYIDIDIKNAAQTFFNGQSFGSYVVKAKNAGGVSNGLKINQFKL